MRFLIIAWLVEFPAAAALYAMGVPLAAWRSSRAEQEVIDGETA